MMKKKSGIRQTMLYCNVNSMAHGMGKWFWMVGNQERLIGICLAIHLALNGTIIKYMQAKFQVHLERWGSDIPHMENMYARGIVWEINKCVLVQGVIR
ncbi:MAG: hypothetical protein OI74_09370 [Gammaproteobacteria bacterium (ex Lamellibrachia satsuma)]|nr:MAG: hypothetical protein OI74_09370 [Gammaproteobacteria bacterium (ex Lamellibrachia satsuma)]RRS36639.1 MAG: hypothetical protein NV67_06050 [Gammaproteobacteria bacterium (ex Lamellibrachia satsuma)]